MEQHEAPVAPAARERAGPFRALRYRNFRLFVVGQGVSLVGTWMQSTAQAWLVLTLTDSPFLLGVIGALQYAPILLFGLATGAVADRVSKRRLLLLTQTVLMLLAFTLAALVALGVVRFWHVALLAALFGLTTSLDMPARQSFYVEMVERPDLPNAVALNTTIVTIGLMIGPAVAGVVIARYGVATAVFLNGASFIAVLAALVAMRPRAVARPPREGFVAQVREGLAYVWNTPAVLTTLALVGAMSATVLNFSTIAPVLARQALRGTAQTYGFLMAASGAGSVVGAIGVAFASRAGPRRAVIVAAAAVTSAAVGLVGLAGAFPAAAALALVEGIATAIFISTCNAYVQVHTPDVVLGRVMSVYGIVFRGFTPFGALIAGGALDLWGPRVGCLVTGALGAAATVAIGSWASRSDRAARPAG